MKSNLIRVKLSGTPKQVLDNITKIFDNSGFEKTQLIVLVTYEIKK